MKSRLEEKESTRLACFKDYDIRGIYGSELTENIAYNVGKALAVTLDARRVAIGYDVRHSSSSLATAVSNGLMEFGVKVLDLGMVGTEEMYWAVSNFDTCAGIEITASHNPIEYNGMKFVKEGSQPLCKIHEFEKIHTLTKLNKFPDVSRKGYKINIKDLAKFDYVKKITSFVDTSVLRPVKIVINSGHGTAGPTFDEIRKFLERKSVDTNFVCINQKVEPTFPNGVPNPLIVSNRYDTSQAIIEHGADFGVAFDADFDRCFIFDELGEYIPSSKISSLLAGVFLSKKPGSTIVHDTRLIWSITDAVEKNGGKLKFSKAGHAHIKQAMRQTSAVYGAEISGHHYFKEFSYCDSGMVPWMLIWELLSKKGAKLSNLIEENVSNYQISEEINLKVNNSQKVINAVMNYYKNEAIKIDLLDGVNIHFRKWRFSLRASSTEPMIRLNTECQQLNEDLSERTKEIIKIVNLVN